MQEGGAAWQLDILVMDSVKAGSGRKQETKERVHKGLNKKGRKEKGEGLNSIKTL